MYKRPSYDIKTTGIFTFKTKDKEYLLKSYSFERENDTEDSLEIQDELRGEIGSIRIKNSAWNKLAKGQTILAKTSKSKGDIVGKLTRIDDINNSLKYAKGGISGDIFSVKDPKLFKQILNIYNEFSEKFGVDNYFLDHNNNSVIFLRKKPFTPTEIDNMTKRILALKEKQDFDVLNKNKNTESSGGTFKFFLKNTIKYADGGMSVADANPYIAGAKAVQGIAPESVSAIDKRVSSRINPDPNRPVFFNLGGRLDLFEDYENIPAKVQAVLDKYADKFGDDFSEMSYSDTAKMQKDIEKLGYTFNSGLDNMPYGLRPIGVKLSELQGFEDDEEYAKGGWILYDADTDSKIGEFETETKARKMMYEYEGNSNIVAKSVWDKSSEKDKSYKNNTMEKKTSRFAKGGGVKGKLLELYEFYDEKTNKTLLVDAYSEKEAEDKISKIDFNDFQDYDNIGFKKVKNIKDVDTKNFKIEDYKKGKSIIKIFYDKDGSIAYIFTAKGSLLKEFSFDRNSKYIFNEEENYGYYTDKDSFSKGGATYIPNADIESIKLRYGKTIKGSKLLDGAYAKGNLKLPTMSRTQFEDETFEYAKGGGFISKGELVWKKLSSSDKINFLYENFTPQITPRSQATLVGTSYNFLPKNVKMTLASKYANVEEYAKGGGVGIDSTFESENDSLNTFKGYNDYFIIEFNGKVIHSVKTKSQHLKKLNELVDKYNLTEIKQKNSEFSNGGGVGNFKVVTFTGDYGGEDNNYYVVDETENDYLTVQEDMFDKWKNADKFDRAEYYSEWIPKSEMVEINKMAKGGGVNLKRHTPRIYVADLEAYNNGRLKGEWIDLSDFDSGAEVLEEISKMLKKTGGEEYAIHDYEYFPSIMYSEYMGEKQFDNVIEAYKIAEDKDLDIDVVGEIIEQYSPDNVEEFIDDNYQGQFDNDTDFAYQYVENLGGFENINESEKEMYFDYEAFGRDLVINDFFTINDHYFVNPRYARGGTTYIPNRDIESIKLRYGKTIKGSKLLDGAYAKGNLKTPTMSRTQFEDESFEYAKGGGIKSEYHIFEGMNHRNGNPIYRVESNSDSKNEYVGEWHTSKSEAEEELADCSSKYAKGGGVSYHNGRKYATGRNWTNDYQHENRSEDWEVPQADRKRYATGGRVGKSGFAIMQRGSLRTDAYSRVEFFDTIEKALFKMSHVPNFKSLTKEEKLKLIVPYTKGKEFSTGGGVDGRTRASLDNVKTFRVTKEDANDKVVYTKDYDTLEEALNDSYTPHKEGGNSWVRGYDKDDNFIQILDRRSHWGDYKKLFSNGGGVGKHIYNVAFSTKNGSSYVANNIEASSEAEAISKLEKQMRASKTYDKVISVSKKYSLGGEIETKIAKLQVVIDSKLLPDSVKVSAKTKQDALRKELHESKETKAEEKAEHKVGGEEARKTLPTPKPKSVVKEPIPKHKVGDILKVDNLKKDGFLNVKIEAVTGWTGKEHRYNVVFLDEKYNSINKYATSYDSELNFKLTNPPSTSKPKPVVEPKIQIKAIKLQPKPTAQEKPKVVVTEKPKVVVSEKPKATVITKTPAKTTSTKKYDNRGSKKPDSDGRFKRSITSDKKRTALPLGKRTSADGNVYYENRLNRADRNPSKKYATGGGVDKSKKEDDMSNEMLFKKGGSLPKGRFTKK